LTATELAKSIGRINGGFTDESMDVTSRSSLGVMVLMGDACGASDSKAPFASDFSKNDWMNKKDVYKYKCVYTYIPLKHEIGRSWWGR